MTCGPMKGKGYAYLLSRVPGRLLTVSATVLMLAVVCFVIVNDSDSSDATGETSGSCGANLTWTYDAETGALIIMGAGAMDDYDQNDTRWGGNTINSASISHGVTSIGNNAFRECTSLTSITIPDSVTSIGQCAFLGCSSLTSVSIPDTVTTIDYLTFSDCSSLTSVSIPDTVTTIAQYAFFKCTSLTSIAIPDSVLFIGDDAFSRCYSLTAINVDDSNADYSSDNGVLFNKTKTQLILYPAAKADSMYAIPDSVSSIKNNAFERCFNLASINAGDGNSAYSSRNGVLFNKSETSLIMYPAGKTDISYSIPEGTQTIDSRAFYYDCRLVQIIVPESVTEWALSYHGRGPLYEVVDYSGNVFLFNLVNYPKIVDCIEHSTIRSTEDGFIYGIDETSTFVNVIAYTGTYDLLSFPNDFDGKNYSFFNIRSSLSSPSLTFNELFQGKTFYDFDGNQIFLGDYNFSYQGTSFIETEGNMIRVGTISFDTNGGSTISMIYGTPGTVVSTPQNPIKEGYDFVGWYTNTQFYGNEYNFTTIPESDVRLYAKYIPSMHVIRVNVNDGNMGHVDISELTGIPYDSVVTVGDGVITVDGKTIRAIPADMTVDSIYSIQSISIPDGYVIKGDTEITITFARFVRQYSVQFIALGEVFHSENVDYGSPINYTAKGSNLRTDHIQYYFQNWKGYQPGTIVTGDLTYDAYYLGYVISWSTIDNRAYVEAKINTVSINRDLLLSLLSSGLNSVEFDMLDATINVPLTNATIIQDIYADSYSISMSGILSDELKKEILPEDTTHPNILEYKKYFYRYPVVLIGTPIDSGVNKETCTLKWSLLPFLKDFGFEIYSLSSDNESWHEIQYVSDENGVSFDLSNAGMYVSFVYGGTSDDSFDIRGKAGDKIIEIDVTDLLIDDTVKTVSLGVESGWNMVLPSSTVTGKEGAVKASVETVSTNTVTDRGAVIPRLQGSTVYSINLSVGDESITTFSSAVKLTLPYKLADGKDPKNLIILYVADGQIKEEIQCDYSDGFVSFETTHLSLYAIAYEEPNSGSEFPILYIGIGAVAVLAVLCGAFFIIRKRA